MNALFLKRALLFVRELSKTLEDANLKSEGLLRLRKDVLSLACNENIPEAIRFCAKFEGYSIYKNTDYKVEINSDGAISSCSAIDDIYVKYAVTEAKGLFSFFKKPKEEEKKDYALIPDATAEFYENLASGALSELSVNIGLAQNLDCVLIGTIMMLIPGLALGTAVYDMFNGNLISGMMRALQCLVVAIFIAIGYAAALWVI
jgi:hypothetical protein